MQYKIYTDEEKKLKRMANPLVDICSDSFRYCLFLAPDEKQPAMSESQNIEERPEDGKTESREEVHSNISPVQIITPAEIANQTSEISKSEITTSDILTRYTKHLSTSSNNILPVSKNIS